MMPHQKEPHGCGVAGASTAIVRLLREMGRICWGGAIWGAAYALVRRFACSFRCFYHTATYGIPTVASYKFNGQC